MSQAQKLKKDLFRIRKKKRDLKGRISQSMSDRGSCGTTGNCKNLQKELAQVVKTEKNKKKKLRGR